MNLQEARMTQKDVYVKFEINKNEELVFVKYLIESELLAEFPLPIEIKHLIEYIDEIQKGGWLKFENNSYVKFDLWPTNLNKIKLKKQ
jgi:hypothetical protein